MSCSPIQFIDLLGKDLKSKLQLFHVGPMPTWLYRVSNALNKLWLTIKLVPSHLKWLLLKFCPHRPSMPEDMVILYIPRIMLNILSVLCFAVVSGLIQGLHPANERRPRISPVIHTQTHTPQPPLVRGYIGFTPSVRPSVLPAYVAHHVRSVAPTVLVRSISYSYVLPSNFRRCVTCQVACKISIFGNFFKFVTFTLSCFDLGFDMNHKYG